MARAPVLAAGGIVLRQAKTPLVAVVRLRKRNEWVLPKGKLDDGETPRAAAEREVMEETGHDVFVHEFLGTLVYESRGGSKVVHYWRMEARGDAVHELMRDVRAVDWLPLGDAVDRLSRGYERAFLENVGPIALAAARKARAKPAAPAKRRPPRIAESAPSAVPTLAQPQSDQPAPPLVHDDEVSVAIDAAADVAIVEAEPAVSPSFAPEIEPVTIEAVATPRKNLLQRMRDWLRRAA
jgi:8-oxo-dGTP diphosphatase